MKVKLKWQQEIIDNIAKMSNADLLDEALCLAGGDDYDGFFTKRGQWEYNALIEELHKRLGKWLQD